MTIEELNHRFGTDPAVRFSAGQGGLPLCTLTTPSATAQVYLYGAHVASYEPAGQKPVLYMSPRSSFVAGRPIRGGVPVCLPWFGPRANDPSAPAHGFARTQPWSVIDTKRSGDAISLSLQLNVQADATWPVDFGAILRVTLGEALRIELQVINRSEKPFQFTEALHSYFCVSDVRGISVTGLEQDRFFDKVAGGEQAPTGREIRFEGETDRVYLDTEATCMIHDPQWSRKIEVSKRGSKSTVVWNPHVKKAASLPDLGEDTWPHFVCVETANALANAVTLAPGNNLAKEISSHVDTVHIMSQSIRVLKG